MSKETVFVPRGLIEFFDTHRAVALAFSGGCDSAYLLYAARSCGANVMAYCVQSQFQPRFEVEDAKRLADQLKCDMRLLKADVLACGSVRSNPADRCCHCKRILFDRILSAAREDGYDTVIDGTNASDPEEDRPGMRVLGEMHVLSPLRICGIDKGMVRFFSRQARLFSWNKPAYACLATRIPAGTEITESALKRIEESESTMAEMGFTDFRVRETVSGARIEVIEDQILQVILKRNDIIKALSAHYSEITLNLTPRKGSIDG